LLAGLKGASNGDREPWAAGVFLPTHEIQK